MLPDERRDDIFAVLRQHGGANGKSNQCTHVHAHGHAQHQGAYVCTFSAAHGSANGGHVPRREGERQGNEYRLRRPRMPGLRRRGHVRTRRGLREWELQGQGVRHGYPDGRAQRASVAGTDGCSQRAAFERTDGIPDNLCGLQRPHTLCRIGLRERPVLSRAERKL